MVAMNINTDAFDASIAALNTKLIASASTVGSTTDPKKMRVMFQAIAIAGADVREFIEKLHEFDYAVHVAAWTAWQSLTVEQQVEITHGGHPPVREPARNYDAYRAQAAG